MPVAGAGLEWSSESFVQMNVYISKKRKMYRLPLRVFIFDVYRYNKATINNNGWIDA